MTTQPGRIKDLIIRHLKKKLSEAEQVELMHWVEASPENAATLRKLENRRMLVSELRELSESKLRIRQKIENALPELREIEKPEPTVIYSRRRFWYYAAASLLLILSATWLLKPFQPNKTTPVLTAHTDIPAGTNKATLTLSDNSVVTLGDAANGSLGHQGNTELTKNNNQLSYSTSKVPAASNAVTYNTLTTPNAGQFQLVLPDGTKVWLNNASSLRYPTSFTGASRNVTLTGEAFFDVAADPAHPFIVNANHLSIDVLGTSFNISSYSDEPSIRTTLVSGKIALSESGKRTLIAPGQQAITPHDGGSSVIRSVDTDEIIAWKEGYFHFNDADLPTVLRQLARWYDISIEIKGATPAHSYYGDIKRDLPLSSILKHLEYKDVHFSVEGRKLIVSK